MGGQEGPAHGSICCCVPSVWNLGQLGEGLSTTLVNGKSETQEEGIGTLITIVFF